MAARNRCRNVFAGAALASGVIIAFAPAEALAAPAKRAKTGDPARDPDDAKLRTGIALFEARNYTRALAEFERAHAATKRPRAMYWIARTNEESSHRAVALRGYEQYLREAGSEARDATEVMGRVQMLTLQLGLVVVRAPAGALIAIDDSPVGKAPLAGPIYVEPGMHKVTADGEDEYTIELEPEGHEEIQFAAHEKKNEVAGAPPFIDLDTSLPAQPARVEEAHSGSALTIGGLAVSGLLAASSVYFTVKSLGTASDFAQKKGERGASHAELEALQGQTRLQAGVALGTGVAALASAGLALFVFRKPSQTETRVAFSGSGIDIAGRF